METAWLFHQPVQTIRIGRLGSFSRRGGAFKRPLGELSWQGAVVSVQRLLGFDLVVGGRTAIEVKALAIT
jgi:hypothetical protein